MDFMKKNAKGILLCLCIALPAYWMGKMIPVIGGPVFAIGMGMFVTCMWKDKTAYQSGIQYTSKKILQYAVILLGFGMNLNEILSKGYQSLPIILSTITTSLVVAYVLSKWWKIPSRVATLIGVGSSICGGSAIAATAPVIEADDEEIAQAISVIFLFNIIAALIFPAIGNMIGLSNTGFGIFAGSAINDTSSVTAAATAWDGIHGSMTLNDAAIVKLTRTLAIIPITLGLALYRTKKEKDDTKSTYKIKDVFPFFVVYFILASVITTVFSLSPEVCAPLKNLSKFFIVMAMSAIGLNTNVVTLIKRGGKPILLGFSCWCAIAVVCLILQFILGLW